MTVVDEIYRRIDMYKRQLEQLDRDMTPHNKHKHVDMLDANIKHFEILLKISKLRREVYDYEK